MDRMRRRALGTRVLTLRRNERGSQLTEFAFVAILLFMLVFGIMEFGRAIWMYDTVAHAAREGARYAIVRGAESGQTATAGDVQTYVQTRATGMTAVTVTTTWEPDNNPGSVVQVRVDTLFQPVVPFLPATTLTSTSRMVISF